MASINLQGDTSGSISISAPSVAGSNTLTLPKTTQTLATQNALGVRNLIINGDMRIAQRGTSKTGITGNGYYTVDRFDSSIGTGGTWTQTQSTDVPSGQGFTSSLKMDCTTANASLGTNGLVALHQAIEAQNLQHIKFGTSSAESLTLSFWVKSNKTGTYTTEFYLHDDARQNSQTFTIDTSDTWEKKTITIDGDTIGVIDNNNGAGLTLFIWLASGTTWTSGTLNTSWASATNANRVSSSNVNLADSTSNYINITGVQLEVGDTATPFEHRPYEMELARCQRYYEKSYNYGTSLGDTGGANICSYIVMAQSSTSLANNGVNGVIFKVRKRGTPTMTIYDYAGNSGKLSYSRNGVARANNITAVVHRQGEYSCGVYTTSASGMTAGYAVEQHHHWTADSEL